MKFCSLLVVLTVYISFSNGDVCIDGTSTQNNVYYGNYQKAEDENGNDLLDANGNIYYIKASVGFCDNDEYLYKKFGKWQTNQVLNEGAYALRCPTRTTNPYDCPSGTWENAGNTDTSITVTNEDCSVEYPTISCSYIDISSDDFNSQCLGSYNPVTGEDNVFINQDSGWYFYYNQYRQLYECGKDNEQDYCQAFVGNNTYGLRTTDSGIGALQDGDSLTISLTYPPSKSANIDCLANPPTPPPVSDDDLCLSVNTAYSVNGVKLEDIAGIYEPMTDPNGEDYQAYQLKDCSNNASIYYSSSYNRFIIYSDTLDLEEHDFVFYCTTNGVDFNNCDEYTEYNLADYDLFELEEISSGDICSCGQSMTGSNAMQPHGIVKINDIIDNNVGVVTSIGAWQLFVNTLGTETGAIILTIIFLLMLVWTVSMCGYQFGISNKGKSDFKYKPAIAIDDEA